MAMPQLARAWQPVLGCIGASRGVEQRLPSDLDLVQQQGVVALQEWAVLGVLGSKAWSQTTR